MQNAKRTLRTGCLHLLRGAGRRRVTLKTGLGGGKGNRSGGPDSDKGGGWCPGVHVAKVCEFGGSRVGFCGYKAQAGDDFGKRHWGQFVKSPLLHVKYKMTSVQVSFLIAFLLSPSTLHLTVAATSPDHGMSPSPPCHS